MWRSDTGIVCELSCGGFILKYPRLPRESPSYIGRGPLWQKNTMFIADSPGKSSSSLHRNGSIWLGGSEHYTTSPHRRHIIWLTRYESLQQSRKLKYIGMHSYYPETKSTCNLQGVNARKLDKDILEHIYYLLTFTKQWCYHFSFSFFKFNWWEEERKKKSINRYSFFILPLQF